MSKSVFGIDILQRTVDAVDTSVGCVDSASDLAEEGEEFVDGILLRPIDSQLVEAADRFDGLLARQVRDCLVTPEVAVRRIDLDADDRSLGEVRVCARTTPLLRAQSMALVRGHRTMNPTCWPLPPGPCC